MADKTIPEWDPSFSAGVIYAQLREEDRQERFERFMAEQELKRSELSLRQTEMKITAGHEDSRLACDTIMRIMEMGVKLITADMKSSAERRGIEDILTELKELKSQSSETTNGIRLLTERVQSLETTRVPRYKED